MRKRSLKALNNPEHRHLLSFVFLNPTISYKVCKYFTSMEVKGYPYFYYYFWGEKYLEKKLKFPNDNTIVAVHKNGFVDIFDVHKDPFYNCYPRLEEKLAEFEQNKDI